MAYSKPQDLGGSLWLGDTGPRLPEAMASAGLRAEPHNGPDGKDLGCISSVSSVSFLLLCLSNGPLIDHLAPKLGAIRINPHAASQMAAGGLKSLVRVPGGSFDLVT
jgi:hypothetical protein